MIVKQVKISNQSKERLSRLKGKTGIKKLEYPMPMGTVLFFKRTHCSDGSPDCIGQQC